MHMDNRKQARYIEKYSQRINLENVIAPSPLYMCLATDNYAGGYTEKRLTGSVHSKRCHTYNKNWRASDIVGHIKHFLKVPLLFTVEQ